MWIERTEDVQFLHHEFIVLADQEMLDMAAVDQIQDRYIVLPEVEVGKKKMPYRYFRLALQMV